MQGEYLGPAAFASRIKNHDDDGLEARFQAKIQAIHTKQP
jgi:hypothetical protein